ncbi:hypothetical protein OSB04_024600 [Centaurea solstitialis]|uniref:CCHC-type domain-containing protein n=1 Tax=Centaurea solstitialis TaxID=347529 RepID=A0AA38STY4_9ASTR|nr:hypothetical protein OSB04_024600 [Centaurea solstitialis]
MANTVTNTNNLSLRSILEKDKLTGANFLDWERNLMIVLRHERKWYVLEEPLGEAPPANATANVRNAYRKHSDDLLDVGCLMLATMSPDLQTGLMNTNAYDMIRQLRDMFQTQARTERYDATRAFNACKMAKGTSVSDHVMKMKKHIDHLERLGHPVPLQLATDTILNSLSEDYKQFVINYNMNNMEKTIAELHSMLKTAELSMGTGTKTKDVLMVGDGGAKRKRRHGNTSKGRSQSQASQSVTKVENNDEHKGKGKKVKPNKARTENRCFICHELGHWRQNCPKRHKAGNNASVRLRSQLFSCQFDTRITQNPNRCYILNNRDNLGKFDKKADEGYFLGYSLTSKTFRVYNKRTNMVMETVYVTFDETVSMTSEHSSSELGIHSQASTTTSDSITDPNSSELDLLFMDAFLDICADNEDLVLSRNPRVDIQDVPEPSSVNDSGPSENVCSTSNSDQAIPVPSVEQSELTPDDQSEIPAIIDENDSQNNLDDLAILPAQLKWTRAHPLYNVIGDVNDGVKTRSASANYCLYKSFLSVIEPKNVSQALEDSDWLLAMQEELLQFKRNKVYRLVPRPQDKSIIKTKWIFRNKKDESGLIVRNKARLVAKGYSQQEHQEQPEGFVDPDFPDHVCILDKSLYGLKQAPRAWYETLTNHLLSKGFKRGTIDTTLFLKKEGDDLLLVQIYVDDIIFGSTNPELCTKFSKIMETEFEMSMMGELNFFLGIQVKQNLDGIFINQPPKTRLKNPDSGHYHSRFGKWQFPIRETPIPDSGGIPLQNPEFKRYEVKVTTKLAKSLDSEIIDFPIRERQTKK